LGVFVPNLNEKGWELRSAALQPLY
jgi:hypothetical protein